MINPNANKPATQTRPTAIRPVSQLIIGGVVIPLLVLLGVGIVVARVLSSASAELTVPQDAVLLIHAAPDNSAPVIARFGAAHPFQVTGRTADWRWLEVSLWDGKRGWALRPLDILVWQIIAQPAEPPSLANMQPTSPTLIEETMIDIKGGTFTMGSAPGIGQADETPVRTVTLAPYQIDRTEVTVGQYWQCVIAHACTPPLNDAGPNNAHYSIDPAFDSYPVINVTWEQANTYCGWRNKRLPTEAEWEMAAGWDLAKNAKPLWPWGNAAEVTNINIGPASAKAPTSVGSNTADHSPNGVLDMGGNVREWVFDWYKVDYYSAGDNNNPQGPTYRRGEGQGHVVRGGSYATDVSEARAANRGNSDSVYGNADIGFRCAKSQR